MLHLILGPDPIISHSKVELRKTSTCTMGVHLIIHLLASYAAVTRTRSSTFDIFLLGGTLFHCRKGRSKLRFANSNINERIGGNKQTQANSV